MKLGIIVALGLLLTCAAVAQTTSSPQQPAANTQVQSDTKTSTDTQKDIEKKDDSKTRFHLGGVTVAGGYSYFSGPFFYDPFWGYRFYPYSFAYPWSFSGLWYSPFYGPYITGFGYGPDKGEVKLSANPKDAQVFVDGAYAGTANHLKSMWLDSGAYDLSVSAPGKETFHQRIYVLSGKHLKIDARLAQQKESKEEKR